LLRARDNGVKLSHKLPTLRLRQRWVIDGVKRASILEERLNRYYLCIACSIMRYCKQAGQTMFDAETSHKAVCDRL
jgi:hypothetical protein